MMGKSTNKPLLICLTSTRNYGWVTSAFLKANSLWADYIIIVDQMSTDGTREMAMKNPKVILLDNEDMAYSETKRCEMAIERARQIDGDKILIYLAIDEVFPANVEETEDWKKIIHSEPGEVFCFQWANILPDKKNYISMDHPDGSPFWMARGFHDDGITPYNNEGLDMHTHTIPYPQKDLKESVVTGFRILHFAFYNEKWNIAKQRFYQFVDFDKNNRSLVALSRMYNRKLITDEKKMIPSEWIHSKEKNGFDLFKEVDTKEKSFLDDSVLKFISENGIERYAKLDVWDKAFLDKYSLQDPRSVWIKFIHFYLRITQKYHSNIIVRVVDKVFKELKI